MNAAEYLISTFEILNMVRCPSGVCGTFRSRKLRARKLPRNFAALRKDHYAGVMIVLGNDPEDYLKEPLLRRYRWALEEARPRGWFLQWDENGFPSRIGGGAFDGEEMDYAYPFLKKGNAGFSGENIALR